MNGHKPAVMASIAGLLMASSGQSLAESAGKGGQAADEMASFFSTFGDQIYGECIFELSQEQIEVQQALINAYIAQGASPGVATRLAVKQIQPPIPSANCERLRSVSRTPPLPVEAKLPPATRPPAAAAAKSPPEPAAPAKSLANLTILPQWDCAPGVDFVTIKLKGYERKLTGGEICSPFEDVVNEVSPTAGPFKLGYTIKTGRLFVAEGDARVRGKTITWGLSGRDVCRNNPDPDCLAARALGPLPPGDYKFADSNEHRINWGPRTQRNVAGIYLKELWYRESFNPQQTAAILSRGNIAIHMRLKGEMSEACIGLEPKGWAYVAALIKDMRTTGLAVYIEDPYPQIAENPPVVVASTFSFTSLFKQ